MFATSWKRRNRRGSLQKKGNGRRLGRSVSGAGRRVVSGAWLLSGGHAAAGFLLGCRGEPQARPAPAGAPRRVVALAPNLTEIVFALGAGDSLIGVSEYSDFPEAARKIPRVGGLEVDAEKVAALRPDLVLAEAEGTARGAVHALEAAGVKVLVVPSGSLDAVIGGIRLVGGRLGRSEEAARLADGLVQRRDAPAGQPAQRAATSL